MNLYAPKYYSNFHCIADRCKHSCCIGWEIDIDTETLKKYQDCTHCYGEQIRASIDSEETPHFRLGVEERCPHLNERGLCKIILSAGEDLLCDICREHPRFYHDTSYGKEVGIGMACEEACRLILSSDEYAKMIKIEELPFETEERDFDAIAHRERVFLLLSDRSLSYFDRMNAIALAYDVSASVCTDEEWRDLFANLEYLDEAHRTSFLQYTSNVCTPEKLEKPLERAFAYFVFRHCSDAYDMDEFRTGLGFAMLCVRLLASLAMKNEDLAECARILSEELEYSEENTEAIKLVFYDQYV